MGVQKPITSLIPNDTATTNLQTLNKKVKFLDSSLEAGSQAPSQATLSAEFKKRKLVMDENLRKMMDNAKVARIPVPKKSKEQQEAEEAEKKARLRDSPLARLMEDGKKKEEPPPEVFGEGFVRSKRNQHFRVKAELLQACNKVEEEKTALIQKLNRALLKLDKQNEAKKDLSEKLLQMVKFVRDLQRAASSGDDIEGVVSSQMKTDFKREKELNQRLSEELQRCEKERLRLLERIKLLSGEK